MKNFKSYIFGISATLLIALTISTVAFAHGGDNSSSRSWGNSMMGGMGMMGGSMWGGQLDDQDWEGMQKMHDLMWKEGDLTQDEFEWMINQQEEHMGWSWLENRFDNVDEYNEQGGQMGFGRGMGMGMGMMRGCPMWR